MLSSENTAHRIIHDLRFRIIERAGLLKEKANTPHSDEKLKALQALVSELWQTQNDPFSMIAPFLPDGSPYVIGKGLLNNFFFRPDLIFRLHGLEGFDLTHLQTEDLWKRATTVILHDEAEPDHLLYYGAWLCYLGRTPTSDVRHEFCQALAIKFASDSALYSPNPERLIGHYLFRTCLDMNDWDSAVRSLGELKLLSSTEIETITNPLSEEQLAHALLDMMIEFRPENPPAQAIILLRSSRPMPYLLPFYKLVVDSFLYDPTLLLLPNFDEEYADTKNALLVAAYHSLSERGLDVWATAFFESTLDVHQESSVATYVAKCALSEHYDGFDVLLSAFCHTAHVPDFEKFTAYSTSLLQDWICTRSDMAEDYSVLAVVKELERLIHAFGEKDDQLLGTLEQLFRSHAISRNLSTDLLCIYVAGALYQLIDSVDTRMLFYLTPADRPVELGKIFRHPSGLGESVRRVFERLWLEHVEKKPSPTGSIPRYDFTSPRKAKSRSMHEVTPKSRQGMGNSYGGTYRRYVPGDDIRRIDFRASARLPAGFLVKEFEQPSQPGDRIHLDLTACLLGGDHVISLLAELLPKLDKRKTLLDVFSQQSHLARFSTQGLTDPSRLINLIHSLTDIAIHMRELGWLPEENGEDIRPPLFKHFEPHHDPAAVIIASLNYEWSVSSCSNRPKTFVIF